MDAIENDVDMLCTLNPLLILEIGSGSGCVINFVSKMLSSELKRSVAAIAVDINYEATIETIRCANRLTNMVTNLDAMQTSLLDGIRPSNQFDIVFFNPPYVPSDFSDVYLGPDSGAEVIDAAWAGGNIGRFWTDKFLEKLIKDSSNDGGFLSPNAIVYFVALESNSPEELMTLAVERWGFSNAAIVEKRHAGIERLSVIRLSRWF